MPTAEQIEKRIADLEAEREVHMARANAASGAIFELRRWLAELQKPAESTPAEAKADE